MDSPIFIALVEVCPEKGAFLDPQEFAGAFVRCYVPASDPDEALTLLAEDLEEGHFQLVGIEWCVNMDEVEWDNPDDPTAEALATEARETNQITYGEFHVWPHED